MKREMKNSLTLSLLESSHYPAIARLIARTGFFGRFWTLLQMSMCCCAPDGANLR